MVETLCRRTKRNPVLVGPPRVGKTAIVEGLAQRIVRGEVPGLLQNVRIVELQPSSLVAGASAMGELNRRMKAILAEAAQGGIILFVDELHSMIGAGVAEALLLADLVDQADLIVTLDPTLAAARRPDLETAVLTTLAERYRKHGLTVQWDDSLTGWLRSQLPADAGQLECERLVDSHLIPSLLPYLSPSVSSHELRSLLITCREGSLQIEIKPLTP